MRNLPLYKQIAGLLIAIQNIEKQGPSTNAKRHFDTIREIMNGAPSGSGIDNGIEILLEECTPEKLVFSCDYHHMNDDGMYDGWTHHVINVKANLYFDIDIRISGKDRNGIKEDLHSVLHDWLTSVPSKEDNIVTVASAEE